MPILTSLVHVHPRRNAFLKLFRDPILEHERGDAFFLKPARDVVTSKSMASATKAPPGAMMTPVPVGFGPLRKVSRQRRSYT